MSGKYTPGPWTVVEGSVSGHCCFDYSITSPLKGGCNVVAEVFCGEEPDANLISAAPEMLEALEAGLMYVECCCEPDGSDNASKALDLARAAIKKAKGETNA